jgi:hypothetical protein
MTTPTDEAIEELNLFITGYTILPPDPPHPALDVLRKALADKDAEIERLRTVVEAAVAYVGPDVFETAQEERLLYARLHLATRAYIETHAALDGESA